MTDLKRFLREKKHKRFRFVFTAIFLGSICCELLIFNFKWISSVFEREIEAAPQIYGAEYSGDGSYRVTESTVIIEFSDINREVKYLYLTPGSESGSIAEASISARDEANDNFISAPGRKILSDVEASKYIRLHFSGKIKSLRIYLSGMEGKSFSVSDIRLNVRVPLLFSWARVLVLTLLITALFVLRPKSRIYRYKTDLTRPKQRMTVAVLLVFYTMIFWGILHWNTTALTWHETMEHHQQYYKLAEAFKQGHLYIDEDVSEELKNMDNPYDRSARAAQGVSFKWDHAYYNGKYYCYFGAVPALLLYLPYNLLTGGNLPNYAAVFLLGVLFMAGTALLLWEIIRKWYRKTPFALYLMLHAVFAAASGLAYAAYKPDLYIIPILSALVFTVFGLSAWLSAETAGRSGGEVLRPGRLALGALCIALTAGCRPQFMLAAFLGVILFWNCTFKKRLLFSRDSVRQTAAVCMPFLLIGALIMWYNAARFGSPFDFGAAYNLTSNDMTHRGFVFGRIGLGIFTYLLQPVRIKATFPFLEEFGVSTAYQGLTLTENLMGGVLFLYPILFIGIYGVFKNGLFADKRIRAMVHLLVFMAVVTAVFDAQMAGLLTRYFSDFVWMLMLASVFTVFALYDTCVSRKGTGQQVIRATAALSAITLIFAFLSILAHGEDSIEAANPTLYYTIQHLIAFWM